MKTSKIMLALITALATQGAFAATASSIEPKKEVIVKADGGCPLAKGSGSKLFDSTNPPVAQASTVKAVEVRTGADSKQR